MERSPLWKDCFRLFGQEIGYLLLPLQPSVNTTTLYSGTQPDIQFDLNPRSRYTNFSVFFSGSTTKIFSSFFLYPVHSTYLIYLNGLDF